LEVLVGVEMGEEDMVEDDVEVEWAGRWMGMKLELRVRGIWIGMVERTIGRGRCYGRDRTID
jgi:hypothetical protein